jgi:coenzyme F420-0:L-glutamate ligase/coenzyme F420-1:gamma-L-glutamate ligase
MAIVDELAGAGELVKGKCDQVPVAVIRGYLSTVEPDDRAGVTALVRDAEHDLFSLGTAEARAAGLRDAALLPDAPPLVEPATLDVAAVDRIIASVSDVVAPGTRFVFAASVPGFPTGSPKAILCYLDGSRDPASLIRFGADMHRLRAALAAEAVASAPLPPPPNHAALALLRLGA